MQATAGGLEYLYLENEEANYQGEQAEDYTFYRENRDLLGSKPDQLHYLKKQLMKPITELLEVKYPREKVPYEKLDDALARCIGDLDPLLKHRVSGIAKKYKRDPITEKHDSMCYGWAAFGCEECRDLFPKKCVLHNPKTEFREYTFTGKAAQVQYILDSAARKKAKPKALNEVDESKYPELVGVCRRWKAWNIINAFHSSHGLKKRTAKRPTQTGEKLRLKTKAVPVTRVIFMEEYQGYPRGTVAALKDIREEIVETSARNKKAYFYTIEIAPIQEGEDPQIMENVPRKIFTTFYYKDSTVVKDILFARGWYKCVVNELNMLFAPVVDNEKKEIKIFELPEEIDGTNMAVDD